MGFKTNLLLSSLIFSSPCFADSDHQLNGKATLLGSYNNSISGTDGADMSRLDGENGLELDATLQIAYEYTNDNFGLFSHLQVTSEAQGDRGGAGLIQLFGYYNYPINDEHSLTFSLGQFFMPSSMENTEDFWDSPYSNNFSALNTWIAEEVRPVGLEVRFDQFDEDLGSGFGLGAMSFVGNDGMGTQLTWRGWSIGRHKSAYGEVLTLPALSQIDEGVFADQRVDGSKPFDRDLDHQYGFLLHSYWTLSPAMTFKFSYLDNGADNKIYHGEYAWETRFSLLGAVWDINEHWRVLGESLWGVSSMGVPSTVGVDVDFTTTYLMVRYQLKQWDYSLRVEQFDARDHARLPAESNDKGRALTVAARWRAFGEPWTVIGQWVTVDVDGRRSRVLKNGTFNDENESQLSLSISYEF
ncbi:MAG: hypothetical protein ACI9FJ_003123 [Alteromonadaceae bacterium]|jgi:hypothetical protein